MNDNEVLLCSAAERLAELLAKKEITQGQLAAKANLTQGQVNHIINKRRIGTIGTWFKIAEALDVPIDYFFSR